MIRMVAVSVELSPPLDTLALSTFRLFPEHSMFIRGTHKMPIGSEFWEVWYLCYD